MSLLWLDLETTGLEPAHDHVLEVAAIITDDALNEVARFERVIYSKKADQVLTYLGVKAANQNAGSVRPNDVHDIVIEMHDKNGLWKASRQGQNLQTVDADLAAFVREHGVTRSTGEDGEEVVVLPQLAGSTISFDRSFIDKHLPQTSEQLHYRNLDVSSFNETAKRFWPDVYAARPKKDDKDKAHRGMADIVESINVLRHYLARLQPKESFEILWYVGNKEYVAGPYYGEDAAENAAFVLRQYGIKQADVQHGKGLNPPQYPDFETLRVLQVAA